MNGAEILRRAAMVTALTRRAGPVRLVSPVPPRDPGPHEDEPFAPVYDYEPLGREGTLSEWIMPGCSPDVLVFGPPGSGDLQNTPGVPG